MVRPGRGEQPALFFVHDDEGLLDYVVMLGSHVDPELALFGLPPPRASPPSRWTLQEMATRLIVMMRDVQPEGPYRLVGRAPADLLAYEVATQLVGEDHTIELLGLLDVAHDFPPASSVLLSQPPGMPTEYRRLLDEAMGEYHPHPIRVPTWMFPANERVVSDWRSARERLVTAEWLAVSALPALQSADSEASGIPRLARLLSEALRHAGSPTPRASSQPHAPLVSLQSGQSGGASIFCVPGAGATVVSFSELVGRLAPDYRIYGFQPRGMDGASVPHTSVAAAARSYAGVLAEMRLSQPIHLLGHSYGGWVAYEMACLLVATGREVASLTMIDTSAPNQTGANCRGRRHSEVLQQWIELFEMVLDRPLGVQASELAALPMDQQLARVHERLTYWRLMPRTSSPGTLRGPFQVFSAALRSQFTPQLRLRGAIHLVTVSDHTVDETTNSENNARMIEGWRLWVPELEIFPGPGNHMTVLKEPETNLLGTWFSGKIQSRRPMLSATWPPKHDAAQTVQPHPHHFYPQPAR